jgi:hypothetical protein
LLKAGGLTSDTSTTPGHKGISLSIDVNQATLPKFLTFLSRVQPPKAAPENLILGCGVCIGVRFGGGQHTYRRIYTHLRVEEPNQPSENWSSTGDAVRGPYAKKVVC